MSLGALLLTLCAASVVKLTTRDMCREHDACVVGKRDASVVQHNTELMCHESHFGVTDHHLSSSDLHTRIKDQLTSHSFGTFCTLWTS